MTTEEKSLGQIAYEAYLAHSDGASRKVAYNHVSPSTVDQWAKIAADIVAGHERRNGVTIKLICDADIAIKAMEDINAAVGRFAAGIKAVSSLDVQKYNGRVVRPVGERVEIDSNRVRHPGGITTELQVSAGDAAYPASDFRIDEYQPVPSRGADIFVRRGIRVTHTPSGLSEECHEHTLRYRNKETAWERLVQRLDKIGRTDDPRWTPHHPV